MSNTEHQNKAWSDVAAERKAILVKAWRPMYLALLDDTEVGDGVYLLDGGCGSGDLSAIALARGARVVGVDIATSMIELCRATPELARGTFVQGDLQRLAISANEFDVAIAAMSTHFCDDPQEALRQLCRVIRPGGRVGISAPGSAQDPAMLVFGVARDVCPEIAADTLRPLTFAGDGVLATRLFAAGFERIQERIVHCTVGGGSFEETFKQQLTWAPVRRAVEKIGREAFVSIYRPVLEAAVGTPDPASLDVTFRIVTAHKPNT